MKKNKQRYETILYKLRLAGRASDYYSVLLSYVSDIVRAGDAHDIVDVLHRHCPEGVAQGDALYSVYASIQDGDI